MHTHPPTTVPVPEAARPQAQVVFSAEVSCAPRKMNNASWSYARRERPGEDFGDSLAGHWRQAKPFCLNSGNIAGRPAVQSLRATTAARIANFQSHIADLKRRVPRNIHAH